ncbi:hypothetical protein TNCV_4598241 [Trichonephila clavipes]|nr:hypothetical protein TNCV_4598241 [Trichonephila clavipes]
MRTRAYCAQISIRDLGSRGALADVQFQYPVGCGSRVVLVSDRGLPCHKFEPSTTKDPSCRERCMLNLSRAQTSSRWCGVVVRKSGGSSEGLLATDLVILNHGQLTRTTPELAPPLLTTPSHQREKFGIHRIHCNGASGRHPSWHGRKAGRPHQQPGQASGGILPKSHVWWLIESRQQPGALG